MSPATPLWAQILPFAVIALVFALRWRRRNQAQRLRPGLLWVAPLIACLAIGTGLWFMPHPQPTTLNIIALMVAASLGIGAGIIRAHSVKLSRHPETGEVMSQTGSFAIVLLLVLFGVRFAMREQMAGPHPAIIFITASMVFALGMIARSAPRPTGACGCLARHRLLIGGLT